MVVPSAPTFEGPVLVYSCVFIQHWFPAEQMVATSHRKWEGLRALVLYVNFLEQGVPEVTAMYSPQTCGGDGPHCNSDWGPQKHTAWSTWISISNTHCTVTNFRSTVLD